jgi:hypothetical protein
VNPDHLEVTDHDANMAALSRRGSARKRGLEKREAMAQVVLRLLLCKHIPDYVTYKAIRHDIPRSASHLRMRGGY